MFKIDNKNSNLASYLRIKALSQIFHMTQSTQLNVKHVLTCTICLGDNVILLESYLFNSLLKQGKRNGEKITPLIRFTRFNINTE